MRTTDAEGAQVNDIRVIHGDSIESMRAMPEASIDAIVTDPPYGLGFMGKAWDDLPPGEEWARECLRVLKPGGHLLAFGGSRTWHRLAVAVEDAGFEIRDSIAWLYGSGFPKSLDVSKAIEKAERGELVRAKLLYFAAARGINGRWLESRGVASATSFADWTTGGHVPSDRNWQIVKDALEVTPEEEAAFEREVITEGRSRAGDGTVYGLGHSGRQLGGAVTDAAKRWQGWGTALKPSFEPIVVGRKPLDGMVAARVLAHGRGALNIDATRTRRGDGDRTEYGRDRHLPHANTTASLGRFAEVTPYVPNDAGRWPTNVALDDSQAAELDRQSGTSTSRIGKPRAAASGDGWGMTATGAEYDDAGGASRFFPTFRYEAKAPAAERPRVGDVAHPTVKPLDLMRWLVRLVTPPGGVVLEPFAGSGPTAEACALEGFQCIAIEREADYLPLIMARLAKPLQLGLDLGVGA